MKVEAGGGMNPPVPQPRQLLLRHASQSSLDESSQKFSGKVISYQSWNSYYHFKLVTMN